MDEATPSKPWTIEEAIDALHAIERKDLFLGYEAEEEEYEWYAGLARTVLGELDRLKQENGTLSRALAVARSGA